MAGLGYIRISLFRHSGFPGQFRKADRCTRAPIQLSQHLLQGQAAAAGAHDFTEDPVADQLDKVLGNAFKLAEIVGRQRRPA